ncbi:hypothetical protein, partial [Nesterenkonia salmonea]|uniref:hypothetical protein n=1 Tax=Nesterenkonia salmonea TaxID=1804987 RepID=UPI001AA09DC2
TGQNSMSQRLTLPGHLEMSHQDAYESSCTSAGHLDGTLRTASQKSHLIARAPPGDDQWELC